MRILAKPPMPADYTPSERLDMAFRKVLTVSKSDILKKEASEKLERGKKNAFKISHP